MKKFIRIVCAIGLFSLTLGFSMPAQAFQYSIPNEDSGDVTFSDPTPLNDNLATFGNVITVNSEINGDLFTAGSQVTINSNVTGNIFVGGGTVNINGNVSRDVFVGAGNATIAKNSIIEGDLIIGTGTVNIDGTVKGKVRGGAGTINVNGIIGKGITANVGTLNIEATSKIDGDIVYTSNNNATIKDGAITTGKIEKKEVPTVTKKNETTQKVFSWLISLLGSLLVGVVLISLFSQKTNDIFASIKTKPWMSILLGFVLLLVIPAAIIFLIITIIGIPLAFITLSLYILAIYFSKIFVGLAIGKIISSEKWSNLWSMTLGILILSLIALIPFVSGIVGFVVVLLGLGATGLALTKK